jgi:serine/threonine protein kinase
MERESSNVAGEGTYGCVHKPPLKCRGDREATKGNKVTKLMKTEEAKKELNEFVVMENVDPDKEYYLGTPYSCKVAQKPYNKTSAEKCKRLRSADPKIAKNLSKYTLLVMEDGGDSLDIFAKKANAWTSADRFEKIERFWLEAHRMFMGVKAFLENGVIHHDLKPQNIVYNTATHRINFIDFGLMTQKKLVLTRSERSMHGLSIFHWSYPLENKFVNKNSYTTVASNTEKIKTDYIKRITTELRENKKTPESDAIRFFLYTACNKEGTVLKADEVMSQILKQFSETVLHVMIPGDTHYSAMLNKCLDTFDSYGMALGLLNVLKNVHTMMNAGMVDDLSDLLLDMTNANVMKRIDIDTAIMRYEDILEKHGILARFNQHFNNHVLTAGPVVPAALEEVIDDASSKSVSFQELKKELKENPDIMDPQPTKTAKITRKKRIPKGPKKQKTGKQEKLCPENKEINPHTGRCVNKCKPGEMRNERFECRKTQRKWRNRK